MFVSVASYTERVGALFFKQHSTLTLLAGDRHSYVRKNPRKIWFALPKLEQVVWKLVQLINNGESASGPDLPVQVCAYKECRNGPPSTGGTLHKIGKWGYTARVGNLRLPVLFFYVDG